MTMKNTLRSRAAKMIILTRVMTITARAASLITSIDSFRIVLTWVSLLESGQTCPRCNLTSASKNPPVQVQDSFISHQERQPIQLQTIHVSTMHSPHRKYRATQRPQDTHSRLLTSHQLPTMVQEEAA